MRPALSDTGAGAFIKTAHRLFIHKRDKEHGREKVEVFGGTQCLVWHHR